MVAGPFNSTPTLSTMTQSDLRFDSIGECVEAFGRLTACCWLRTSECRLTPPIAKGEFLIVLDSPARENEGDLIIAAAHLTPAKAAFMVHHTSGYLCAPMSMERAAALDLPAMVPLTANADPNRTAYTITVDATEEHGVTTGISATDRSMTCKLLASDACKMSDLRRPGHVVPLVAKAGGVRERRGHTEAGWELCRLAGIKPEVSVISEIKEQVDDSACLSNGHGADAVRKPEYPHAVHMMRAEGCLKFGRKWGIRCCTIEDLVRHVERIEGSTKNGSA